MLYLAATMVCGRNGGCQCSHCQPVDWGGLPWLGGGLKGLDHLVSPVAPFKGVVLFAIPAMTVHYPVFAGKYLGMAGGPTLLPESFGWHRLATPIGTWNTEACRYTDLVNRSLKCLTNLLTDCSFNTMLWSYRNSSKIQLLYVTLLQMFTTPKFEIAICG